ncbi:MAG: hypothetical protein ACNA7T_15865, partial [Haliea sp.]
MLVVVMLSWMGHAAPAMSETAFTNWVTLRDAGLVRQERDFSCGVAALATYLTYYLQHPVTEGELLA